LGREKENGRPELELKKGSFGRAIPTSMDGEKKPYGYHHVWTKLEVY